jgi:hypothetical protein
VVAGKERSMSSQGNSPAGELLNEPEIGWVELFAERGQRSKFRELLGGVRGEHTGGGPGGLRHDTAFFEHADVVAAAGQFQGDGEADDSAARDNDVLSLHSSIVG